MYKRQFQGTPIQRQGTIRQRFRFFGGDGHFLGPDLVAHHRILDRIAALQHRDGELCLLAGFVSPVGAVGRDDDFDKAFDGLGEGRIEVQAENKTY